MTQKDKMKQALFFFALLLVKVLVQQQRPLQPDLSSLESRIMLGPNSVTPTTFCLSLVRPSAASKALAHGPTFGPSVCLLYSSFLFISSVPVPPHRPDPEFCLFCLYSFLLSLANYQPYHFKCGIKSDVSPFCLYQNSL